MAISTIYLQQLETVNGGVPHDVAQFLVEIIQNRHRDVSVHISRGKQSKHVVNYLFTNLMNY